jgi:drug/metabolite transporter (DMT)-like permease
MRQAESTRAHSQLSGHLASLLTISIWSTTYVFTKILLDSLTPSQILVVRSILGLLVLTLLYPKRVGYATRADRLLVIVAGVCGIFGYYYLENTALIYTSATNVGVIVAAAPFTTLLASRIFLKEERLYPSYFVGLVLSMGGIILLTVGDGSDLSVHPLGDALAVIAITVWALYTTVTRLIGRGNYPNLGVTRDMFFWGLVGHTIALLISGQGLPLKVIAQPANLIPLLLLGLVASAFCFVLWNYGLNTIGPVKSSFYLYLSPIITILVATTFLGEPFGLLDGVGTALTLGGLVVGQWKKT